MNKNKINNLEEQVKNYPIDEKLIETIGDKAHKLETDAFAQVDFNNLTNPGDLSKSLKSKQTRFTKKVLLVCFFIAFGTK